MDLLDQKLLNDDFGPIPADELLYLATPLFAKGSRKSEESKHLNGFFSMSKICFD